MPLSKEILGRIFDGAGKPLDGLKEVYPEERRDINGSAINPVSRKYPRSCILTGISSIDATSTLIRGQKLPIFSGAGMANGDTITLGDKVYEKVANAGDSTTTTGAIGFNDAAALVTAAGKNGVSVTAADLNQNTTITASYNGTGSAGLVLQVGDTNDSYNKVTVSIADMSAEGLGIANLDVSTQDAAGAAINTIKTAINQVSTNRGNLGALQNRLEHAISNLDTTSENMNSANSAIRDTDMAKEMMNYTKMNILSQAAQAMLAQANQQPQNILQLLK